jgi:hypothetical protein
VILSLLFYSFAVFPSSSTAGPVDFKIPLNASMITVEPGVGSDDENELVDEQSFYPGGACQTSWENWGNPNYPQSVYLDLGKDYSISAVHLFNHGGDGEFRVSSGTPGNWSVFVTDPLIGYTGWESHTGLNVTTRYVRLTKTTNGKMAEIVLFGHPATTAQYALSVTVDWNMGNVYRNPSSATYPAGTQVELTAVPLAGFVFDRWTEGTTPHTANPLTVIMDRDRSITAVFKPGTPTQYTLTTSVTGQGSLSPSGGTYSSGQTVNIHATAASGWKFDHWEGDASGGANPLALVMNVNWNVKAVFTTQGPGTSTKLILTTAMMKDEKTGGYAETPATHLVDEQNLAGDPRAGTGGAAKTHWMPSWNVPDYPWSCYLDLGKEYVLTDIYLYDLEWKSGGFTVSAGAPGNWTPLYTDLLARNNQWFGAQVATTTRYLRFTRLTPTSFVNEVVLYGYPAGGSPTNWSLTVTAQGNGTVAKSPNMASYPDGTAIRLTAGPATGWRFLHWSGDAAGSTNPYSFTIHGDTAISAVFEEIPGSADQIDNPGFELGAGNTPSFWTADAWHMADAKFGWEAGAGRNGTRAASIENTTTNDARWIQPLTLKPDTWYTLTGWVKGSSIVNQTGTNAANLFETKSLTGSEGKSGTFDWTLLGVTFKSIADGSAEIWARLGHWGSTVTGKAWFDDFSLIELTRLDGEHMFFAFEEGDLANITPANLARWLEHLDAAYGVYHDLVGFAPHNGEPLGVVSYRQDIQAWARAAFPIQWQQRWIGAALADINATDDWSFGIMHEMGHHFSHPSWDYDGELWANFLMYSVVEQLNSRIYADGKPYQGAALADFYEEGYWRDKQEYWNTGVIKHNPVFWSYIALARQIGWGPFKQAFRDLYANGNPNAAPIDKFNLFLDKLSQYAGRDVRALIPYDDLYEAEHYITGAPVTRFTLDVTIAGSGAVDFDPDLPYYNEGAPVKLSAVPAAGFKFSGWSGGASGTANPLSITMNANKVITATFTPTGGGTSQKIALTPAMVKNEKTGSYAEWPAANLVDEQALAGDPRAGAGGAVRTFWMPSWSEADYPWSCYLDLGQSYVVTDVYLYDQEWKQGSFSVSAGTPGSWTVLFTDALTRNNQWFGQKVTATTRYLRLTRHATGSFVNEVVVYGTPAGAGTQWSLALAVTGSGTVAKSPDLSSYPDGTPVTLTATPAAGYKFVRWQEYPQIETANPWTVTMDRNRSITAVFEPTGGTSYSLTVYASGSGTVSPSSGSYPAGQMVTITATPAAGWKFDHWESGATGSANPLTLVMDANKSLAAIFLQDGGGGTPQKIPLSAANVQNETGLGNAALLVNEQGAYPAAAATADANVWIPSWNPADYPASAVIDLGRSYVLTKICLWDLGDSGNFTVSSGSTGNWTVLFTDGLPNYGKWNEHAVNVTTRYIRVTKANAAKMGEIVFIGYPAGGGGPVAPPPGQTGDLRLAAKTDTTVTLDWSTYAAPAGVSTYKVYRDDMLITTTSDRQYTDTGLTAGQHLHYLVEAVGAGASGLSNSLVATPGDYYNKISVLTREATVTSSATLAGADANKCLDANIDSAMTSAGVNPAFVQIAFPAAQPIGRARVYLGTPNSTGDANSWRLEAADTEADLAGKSGSYVLAVGTRSGVAGRWDEAAIAPALSRRIFRVTVERTSGGSSVNIREVELYGLDVKTVKKTHNVVLIQYNPVINTPNGSLPVEAYFHDHHWQKWPLAADNVATYIDGFKRATGGLLDLKVKNHYILNEFPPVLDGTPLTAATFLDAYNNNAIDDEADYAKILNDARFNIVPRVESGEIDGVWLITCNSAFFNETRMAGDGAYYVNGAVIDGVTCKRKFVVHGFDYRGRVYGMAHMTGHMAEQTLNRIGTLFPVRWKLPAWNTFDLNDPTRALEQASLTDVKRFFLADSVNYSYLQEGSIASYLAAPGNSQIGSIHFPPNANQNYGYYPAFDWLVVDGSWSAGSGKDMNLTAAGNGVKVVAAPSGLGFIMGDGSLRAKVNVQSAAAGAHAGLLFRTSAYSAGPNAVKGYYVGLDPAGGRAILARVNNGFTIVKTAAMALAPNRDYTVKVTAAGNRFDVYVSNMNVPVFTHFDSNFTHGTIGLCAYNTPARFTYVDFRSTARNHSEAWYAYPDLEGAAAITVGPETWDLGGEPDIQGGDFLFWWYEHLPKNTGIHATNDVDGITVRGRLNTWLPFIFDINNFDGTAVYDAAFPPEDTTAPAPVVNLKAAAITSRAIELTWEEPADNVGVTRYDVYRGSTPIAQVKSPRFTETGLAPTTPYTYTVKARDGFGNRSSASVTATTPESSEYLSDLDWVTAVNGFQSIGVDKANGGIGDLTLGGVRYAKGLGVHANSEITYAIGGAGYKRFRAKVGASDGEWGFSARFEVWGDDVKRFDSGPMYGTTGPTTPIAEIDIDVTGLNSLVIKLVSLDAGISGDHGVWAAARLLP